MPEIELFAALLLQPGSGYVVGHSHESGSAEVNGSGARSKVLALTGTQGRRSTRASGMKISKMDLASTISLKEACIR